MLHKNRLRSLSQELWHTCSKHVTNGILFSHMWRILSGKN